MSLNSHFIAAGFLILSASIIFNADGQNVSNFKKITCKLHDKELVSNMTCFAKAKDRYKTVLNFIAHLTQPVNQITLHIQMYKLLNFNYRPFLVNVTENLCQYFKTKTNSPYLKILMDIVQKYSNMNHTCPYDEWLIFKDMVLDLSSLKLVLPDGDYRFDIEPIVNNAKTPVFSIQAFLEFRAQFGK